MVLMFLVLRNIGHTRNNTAFWKNYTPVTLLPYSFFAMAIVRCTYDFTQHLVLVEFSQARKKPGPNFMGLSNTLLPLSITPPSLAPVIVNIIRSGQYGGPMGSTSLFGQWVQAQEALVHFSHLVE